MWVMFIVLFQLMTPTHLRKGPGYHDDGSFTNPVTGTLPMEWHMWIHTCSVELRWYTVNIELQWVTMLRYLVADPWLQQEVHIMIHNTCSMTTMRTAAEERSWSISQWSSSARRCSQRERVLMMLLISCESLSSVNRFMSDETMKWVHEIIWFFM